MNESIQYRRRMRRLGLSLAFSSALGGTILATERPARAAFDPVTATAYVEFAISLVKLYKSLFGTNGAKVSEQLERIEAAIIGELHVLRNDELQANARSVFTLFADMSDNSKSDPTNPSMWSNIRTLQQTTADAFYQLLQGSDTSSQYALLPTYNVLLATGTAVLAQKREIWSDTSSSWRDFYNWLQPGISADYRMIRSRMHQCSSSNPGYLPMPNPFITITPPLINPAYVEWAGKMKSGKYKDSVLWRKKLANKDFAVEKWTAKCGVRAADQSHSGRYLECNPITKRCNDYEVRTCPYGDGTYTRTWYACDSDTDPVDCADELAQEAFNDDRVVRFVRSSMTSIMTVSGGKESDSSSKNNPLVPQGKIVDPWVPESTCSNSRAYPQVP